MSELVGPSGHIVAVDHTPALLDEARVHFATSGAPARAAFVTADAHSLPFADNLFDAAHAERVLMHVGSPGKMLQELVRVVRTGGWIVGVEPDLAGWRIDFADQDAIRALIRGFCVSWRNPAMGLELPRLMATAGLSEITADVVSAVERDLPPDVMVYYRQAFDTAIGHGWISASHAELTLQGLAEAATNGYFTSYSSLFVVAGRVPEQERTSTT
jgi:SAM-dependent methyltransferase